MKGKIYKAAKKITKNHRKQTVWQRFVRSLAMVVVFCTTYALILPAITMQSDAVCGLDVHTHTEECYRENPVPELVCTQPEESLHQHEAECYNGEGNLICQLPEVFVHIHGDECHADKGETVRELICEKQEHTHTDACYPVEPEEALSLEYRCGYAPHFHNDSCCDEEGNLTCSIPEHAHMAECVVENVDLTADIESAENWEKTISQLELEENWQENVLAIAVSQMGYGESDRNCILVGDTLNGYTRYGDWYGNPYWEWDDMFVSFCLHYAGVPEEVIPGGSDTDFWLEQLKQNKLLYTPQEILPENGDVVFCKGSNGKLFTAVVKRLEANPDADGLRLKLIAGDVSNQVDARTVSMEKVTAVLPVADIQYAYENNEPMAEPSLTIDPTEETAEIGENESATDPEVPSEPTVQTAETENYLVTVTCPADLVLPEGAELRVTEYARDSEIFRQRCEEAGYELEWLLNIGFYIGDEELSLNSNFEVVVTSKQGNAMGGDITHFADSGTERINGSAEEDNVSFFSSGFSDFGGGVAVIAESGQATVADTYNFTTVNPSQLQEGVDYAIYRLQNDNVSFLRSDLSVRTVASGYWTSPSTPGYTWSLTSSQVGSNNPYSILWRVVKSGSQYYLVSQNNQQRLVINNGSLGLSAGGDKLNLNANGSGIIIDDGTYKLYYSNNSWTGNRWSSQTVYFSRVTTTGPNYPHAVHTGEVNINRLRFFNICENGDKGVSALAGCKFQITGANGYSQIVESGDSPEVKLPAGIPDGTYTITEISVPQGYIRDAEYTRSFVIKNGKLASDDTIGTFINHNVEQVSTGKTAEVEDYENRIYQVLLNAESHLRMYEMDPIDLLFVVDQSNSMLFPAGMKSVGKSVLLNGNGNGNSGRLDALNLDKSVVHYVIAAPETTSTVWAVWHDGTAWMCQDASYYAKAKHNNDPGYQDDNETVIFPTAGRSFSEQKNSEGEGVRSNGCDIGRDLSGGSLGNYINNELGGSGTFTIYQATDEYNRLHYLEEALANLIYEMADVNDKSRITLTRFSRTVDEEHCIGPLNLSPENTETLVNAVTSIKTSGGTRQDLALKHIVENHLENPLDQYKDFDHSYTILITDGAPVISGGDDPGSVGKYTDAASKDAKSVYARIKAYARDITGYTEWNGTVHPPKSHLMTVALGMGNVVGGKEVLEEIATDDSFYCAMDDASQLVQSIQKLLFESFKPQGDIDLKADIVDEISDSFYPIAWVEKGSGSATGRQVLVSDNTRDWILLQAGDRITLEGKFSTDSSAPGLLQRKDDGTFYVTWEDQTITKGWSNQSAKKGWKGNLYLKAKEDFIGGNAIDTNKTATMEITTEKIIPEVTPIIDMEVTLPTPTVNVRLLDMNEMHSEVTLYLGDLVNGEGDTPLDSLRYFYENTKFTKLVSGLGDVLNQYDNADGLETAAFYLRYAMGGDLTDEQWARLANGDSITVAYTYDDASSHGPVGYFTFRLEKNGTGSAYTGHEAISACQPGGHPLTMECNNPAETYTLHVSYTAYKLGENGRPQKNVHNGNSSAGPGREVGQGSTIPTGLGVVAKHNVHEVHVISGEIILTKHFAEGITDEENRTFSFVLHRVEDGEDTSKDVTKTITIPAGQTAGSASITFTILKRGTYTVTEAEDSDYAVKHITVTNRTNCYSEPPAGSSGTTLMCIMGNNVANQNVIGKAAETDRYTSYIDPVHGVLCVAEFTNGPIVYTGEIPVEKLWDDDVSSHQQDAVYVVLYLNDTPVVDEAGNARILRLDAASNWKGVFTIVLADEQDAVDRYNYSVREVFEVKTEDNKTWNPAILENDGMTILYYDRTLEAGRLLSVNGKSYVVQYGVSENGQHQVINSRAVELPSTGGMGTHMYTFSGLLAIAAALMYGYNLWRKRERRGVR